MKTLASDIERRFLTTIITDICRDYEDYCVRINDSLNLEENNITVLQVKDFEAFRLKLDDYADLFKAKGKKCVVKVLADAHPRISYEVERAGYEFFAKIYVMQINLKNYHHRPNSVTHMHNNTVITEEFVKAYAKNVDEPVSNFEALFKIKNQLICVYYTDHDKICGTAVGVIINDTVDIRCISAPNSNMKADIVEAMIDKILVIASKSGVVETASVRVLSTDGLIDVLDDLGFKPLYFYTLRELTE